MSWNPKYALLIITYTFIAYMAFFYQALSQFKTNLFVTISFVSNPMIIIYFKFDRFLLDDFTEFSGDFRMMLMDRTVPEY